MHFFKPAQAKKVRLRLGKYNLDKTGSGAYFRSNGVFEEVRNLGPRIAAAEGRAGPGNTPRPIPIQRHPRLFHSSFLKHKILHHHQLMRQEIYLY